MGYYNIVLKEIGGDFRVLSGMIALTGQHKALLRLREEGGRYALSLSPPDPAGRLYLIGPGGEALAVDLDAEGLASLSLPFFPAAALVYRAGAFPLSGGFAGRTDLLEKAKVAVRLQAPAPQKAEAPCPSAPEPAIVETAQRPQPPPQPRKQDFRPQSEALLAALQMAQALFHGEGAGTAPAATPPPKAPPPAPPPAPVSIPNPFPRSFPQCSWRRVNYPGALGHYLTGEGTSRSGPYTVYALPGEYAPVPRRGKGFDKFLRATDGSGYWVRVVRKGNPPKA